MAIELCPCMCVFFSLSLPLFASSLVVPMPIEGMAVRVSGYVSGGRERKREIATAKRNLCKLDVWRWWWWGQPRRVGEAATSCACVFSSLP